MTESKLFALNEFHLHTDFYGEGTEIDELIKEILERSKTKIVNHDFSDFFNDNIREFRANIPLRHYSINLEAENFTQILSKTSDLWSKIEASGQILDGYIEAENVFYNDFGFGIEAPQLPDNLFDKVIDSNPVIIDTSKPWHEFHWTIPLACLRKNIEIFRKSKMRAVGIVKNGVECVVMTTLFPDMQQLSEMYNDIAVLQYGNIKREIKYYFAQENPVLNMINLR
jgi:hypothetical protein